MALKLFNLVGQAWNLPRDTINRSNRFHAYKESLKGNETPEEMMDEILRLAEGTERTIIQSGKYYTFVYYAKTPRIRYDRHPLIKGGVILPKGLMGLIFIGIKFVNIIQFQKKVAS